VQTGAFALAELRGRLPRLTYVDGARQLKADEWAMALLMRYPGRGQTAMMLKGTALSRGVARGFAYVVAPLGGFRGTILEQDVGRELARFRVALEEAERELTGLHEKAATNIGAVAADIIAVQVLVLKDPAFLQRISAKIEQGRVNLETALDETVNQLSEAFAKLDDPYLRERAADLRDVTRRLLQTLATKAGTPVSAIPDGAIIVVQELLPSFAVEIPAGRVKGLVAERGGKTGHAAILARTLSIPAVSGIRSSTATIHNGDALIIDGTAGLVFINPTKEVVREYERLERQIAARRKSIQAGSDLPAQTTDGTRVRLLANIGKSADVEAADLCDADGVGLFRTEFAFLIRESFPSEDEQYEILKNVAEKLHPRPLTIRLLDIGGDKPLPYFPLAAQVNPSLGLRGIRVLLQHPGVLQKQLRAILRVTAAHAVSILVPMVVDAGELCQVKRALQVARDTLHLEGYRLDTPLPVGAMLETPAAGLMVASLAKEADFFSLGTNDLTQYVLAADRTDPLMEAYYQPAHPAVLRLIAAIAKSATAQRKELTICGEMAGDPLFTELLVGLGLRGFSVAPADILEIKARIRSTSVPRAEELAATVLALDSTAEIMSVLQGRERPRNSALEAIGQVRDPSR